MKNLIQNLVIILTLVVLTALAGASEVKNLNSQEAQKLLAKQKNLVLLDVRTPEEYRQARLRGAKLIPVGELSRRVNEIPRDRPLLVYCAVGARSATAADYLVKHGFKDVYQISDGIVGWYRNGLPVDK